MIGASRDESVVDGHVNALNGIERERQDANVSRMSHPLPRFSRGNVVSVLWIGDDDERPFAEREVSERKEIVINSNDAKSTRGKNRHCE